MEILKHENVKKLASLFFVM